MVFVSVSFRCVLSMFWVSLSTSFQNNSEIEFLILFKYFYTNENIKF